ncbi:MAG: alanine--glyoxylate aminotransferase family protein, partial [Chloroflexota bacterium]
RSMAHEWVNERGFGFFAAEGYRSPTVTCVDNTREVDINAMAAFMDERGFAIDKGYGKIKGKTFRIAHMGDMQVTVLEEYLSGLDEFLGV